MNAVYDIAVVGSGFAGSIFAMVARRLGRSVLLIERGRHPRVAIGESSTPFSNLLLEALADRYRIPSLKSLTKWGCWQRSYPALACGLKRGFTFYHHDLAAPRQTGPDADQLLVAASPHDEIADTHWYRSDVDEFLVHEAQRLGVNYVDQVKLESFTNTGENVLLEGCKDEAQVSYRARFVVDATGPRGFMHRALGFREAPLPGYPETRALFSHFSGVKRLHALPMSKPADIAPFPVDDAAVHHVFEDGWIWVLHFNNGVTSAGISATKQCADRLRLSDGESAWWRLLKKIPTLSNQFAAAKREQPFTYVPRLSFRSSAIAGERWAMLPSAAGFIDPLMSTGFPLTLLGVSRLALIVEHSWGSPELRSQVETYAAITDEDLLATSRLIGAMHANMGNFPVFRALSLLYFAAASFSEAAHRLGKPHLASSFLLHDHPGFGQQCRSLLDRAAAGVAVSESDSIVREVCRIIEPIDVAGLRRTPRNFWYPVIAEDLVDAAWKLGATRQEALQMLDRAGFNARQA